MNHPETLPHCSLPMLIVSEVFPLSLLCQFPEFSSPLVKGDCLYTVDCSTEKFEGFQAGCSHSVLDWNIRVLGTVASKAQTASHVVESDEMTEAGGGAGGNRKLTNCER